MNYLLLGLFSEIVRMIVVMVMNENTVDILEVVSLSVISS